MKEFVYTVHKTTEKLATLAEKTGVTVVLPPINNDTPDMTIKGKFLAESIAKSANVIQLESVEMDETDHPSKDGTLQIIKQINEVKPIILPNCEEDTVMESKYYGVQTIFKVGCRGCNNLHYTRSLCADCQTAAQETDVAVIEAEINALRDKMFPIMSDIVMVDASNKNKRGLTDDNNDGEGNIAKAARGGSN